MQIPIILQQRETGGRFKGFQGLHSDKPHVYKFQPGGPEEGWRPVVPEEGSGTAGLQGRGLGHKTKH